ncbi:hypothetical protein PIB30_039513 [Stylosanthes scabra]|uniref:Uncharacterized protein n=1 Tax=Stylosanthes scabra TaxID=79078 RepID=A0ABU6QEU6_9FABA|nr:hypothetical protein [Stylosanthes scabra]
MPCSSSSCGDGDDAHSQATSWRIQSLLGSSRCRELPENDRGLAINAFEGIFTDEGEAMQDATFKLIKKLLEFEDLVITDYNYRIVQRLQGEITELKTRLEMPINERVRELEKANNMMKAELEAFDEACSGYKV